MEYDQTLFKMFKYFVQIEKMLIQVQSYCTIVFTFKKILNVNSKLLNDFKVFTKFHYYSDESTKSMKPTLLWERTLGRSSKCVGFCLLCVTISATYNYTYCCFLNKNFPK